MLLDKIKPCRVLGFVLEYYQINKVVEEDMRKLNIMEDNYGRGQTLVEATHSTSDPRSGKLGTLIKDDDCQIKNIPFLLFLEVKKFFFAWSFFPNSRIFQDFQIPGQPCIITLSQWKILESPKTSFLTGQVQLLHNQINIQSLLQKNH